MENNNLSPSLSIEMGARIEQHTTINPMETTIKTSYGIDMIVAKCLVVFFYLTKM